MAEICGKRILEIRNERGMSQAELARRIRISGSSLITRWEQGRRLPGTRLMPRVATVLGVKTDYLYGLDDGPGDVEYRAFVELATSFQPQTRRLLLAQLKAWADLNGQPGAQNVYLAHHDQWALAQVS